MALIDDAEKLWPHNSSVIALTFPVDTPARTSPPAPPRRSRRWLASTLNSGEPGHPVLRHPKIELANPRDQRPAPRVWPMASPRAGS